jgi:hypothetical protein
MLGHSALGTKALGELDTNYTLTASAGALVLSGKPAGFTVTIPALAGARALSGTAVLSVEMPALPGVLLLTGSATFSVEMPADAGALPLSGSADLVAFGDTILHAEAGALALSGSADLVYVPLQQEVVRSGGGGIAQPQPREPFFFRFPRLEAKPGTLELRGGTAELVYSPTLRAASGVLALRGAPAELTVDRRVSHRVVRLGLRGGSADMIRMPDPWIGPDNDFLLIAA